MFTVRTPVATPAGAFGDGPADLSKPDASPSVLLIDDEETSRYALRQMLAGYGRLRIQEAATGADGVLLDIHLPGIDGFDVMDRLRADPMTAGIPVMVRTSSALTGHQRFRLDSAKFVLSKATLTREAMHQGLNDIWTTAAREVSE